MFRCVALAVHLAACGSTERAAEPGGDPLHAAEIPPSSTHALPHGLRLRAAGRRAIIERSDGLVVTRNDTLIRLVDGEETCPSDGFHGIETVADRFTMHQRTCGGWFLIVESLTFRVTEASEIHFDELVLRYHDRRAAEDDPEVLRLTRADVGVLAFEDVNLDELIRLAVRVGSDSKGA